MLAMLMSWLCSGYKHIGPLVFLTTKVQTKLLTIWCSTFCLIPCTIYDCAKFY